MIRRITNPHKAGASSNARPAVCPTSDGSLAADRVSKIRALHDALGNSICRFPDGSTVQVTPDALKIITPVHEAHQ